MPVSATRLHVDMLVKASAPKPDVQYNPISDTALLIAMYISEASLEVVAYDSLT